MRWKKADKLGAGAFGEVFMAMNLDTGELMAVKEMAIPTNANRSQIEELVQQVLKCEAPAERARTPFSVKGFIEGHALHISIPES